MTAAVLVLVPEPCARRGGDVSALTIADETRIALLAAGLSDGASMRMASCVTNSGELPFLAGKP